MMRPRWQKVLSDLWSNRGRSILVVASIAVGLFAIGFIATGYFVIGEDMRTAYASVNAANVYLQTSLFDQDTVNHIRRMDGVGAAEGVRIFSMRVKKNEGKWEAIELKAFDDMTALTLNRLELLQGRWPKKNEIVVDDNQFKDLNAQVGDTLRFELPNGMTHDMLVVGIVKDLTVGAFSGGGGGYFTAPVQGYIIQSSLEKLRQPQKDLYNGLYVTTNGDGADMEAIGALGKKVSNEMESNGYEIFNTKNASSYDHPNVTFVDAIIGVLLVLGLLSVFLSGFLVTNTLQALLSQQTQQIGIMKSIGARQSQIASVYVVLILVFSLIALLIAMPAAYYVSFSITGAMASRLNFVLQGQRLIPQVLIIQAVLALMMPLAAAAVPIWRGTRISVKEALSGTKEHKIKTAQEKEAKNGKIRLFSGLRALPRPLLIAIRNTFRSKGRLALTLITLSLGGAVFIATFSVQISMNQYILQISQYFLADVNITLNRPYRIGEVLPVIEKVPGVGSVEAWSGARSELILEDGTPGDLVNVLAPPADSTLVNPILIEGRWIQPGDTNAIVLSELFRSRFPDLTVGNTIRLRLKGDNTDWVVVGFFKLAGKNGGFSAYTTYDYLTRLLGRPNNVSTFRVVGDHPNLTPNEQILLGQAVEAALKDEGIKVADITTGSHLTDISGEGFSILTGFLLFLAVLVALVGSIGLAGTMSMNVMERTR
ncbi:MAG: FtsX-like permease family protein, partial [Anaerolineaceae bacterium]|nr:FtsX-like permease family protein [Anaerolineaceae bacterium]